MDPHRDDLSLWDPNSLTLPLVPGAYFDGRALFTDDFYGVDDFSHLVLDIPFEFAANPTHQPSNPIDTSNALVRFETRTDASEPVNNIASVPPLSYANSPASACSPASNCTGGHKRKASDVKLEGFRNVSVKQAKDASAGTFGVFGTAKQGRQVYTPQRRGEVKHTRKVKACERCRGLKTACGRPREPYLMCKGCTSLKNPLILRLPCFLETLTNAQLFRFKASVSHPLYFARANIYDLRDSSFLPAETHTVSLTQGSGEKLTVSIARFLKQEGDKTAHTWKTPSGETQTVEMQPYCIVQFDNAKQAMLSYIESTRNSYISTLAADNITAFVLDEARRFAAFNPTSTVRKALNLLAADRIIERDWVICDADIQDLLPVDDPDNPSYKTWRVTPMMDCQLDQIVIQGFLQPLRKELLEQLQMDINTDRRERWYDIFLTTFVLLANAEQLLAHSRRNAIRHDAKGRYNSPELATLYSHACKIFIAHFFFVCNFKGLLSIDWTSSEALAMAKVDSQQTRFLQKLQNSVRSKTHTMLNLRKNYQFETPSYWTHQLMFDGWSAGDQEAERFHINNAPVACA